VTRSQLALPVDTQWEVPRRDPTGSQAVDDDPAIGGQQVARGVERSQRVLWTIKVREDSGEDRQAEPIATPDTADIAMDELETP
jgi:hypothetical protein